MLPRALQIIAGISLATILLATMEEFVFGHQLSEQSVPALACIRVLATGLAAICGILLIAMKRPVSAIATLLASCFGLVWTARLLIALTIIGMRC